MLSIKTRAKIFGKLINPVLLHGLNTVVYRKVDDNRLNAVQNTTRMMMVLYSVKFVAENVPLRNLASQLHI